ncbi:MAG: bifunctional folylpolyglutamate synthase/dihydrofolate synthase [Eubacterium sp.]|nr:bifunctional folylpolyglutamate synthase/dihydrofolate synthase [Eubacterium sp.]MDD7209987.1 bifunctional folylpolyglutamate synthase/dihydrofolate synthase [Lachnospiraceae bacterium]MDY5496535.1 folylpolyglutamate synthase/dihydrofolate synthase family protein [Anaerobutyricum sp.]
MTYETMEKEIGEIPKFGAKASLSNLNAYLELMNHPERNLRVIHVAGTNGKGSVCAFLESILREAGYRTALFTSPHLVKISERFRINFEICREEDVVAAWLAVKKLVKKGMDQNLGPLTFFEVLFLMALILFSGKDVDYCIMETGLGGRLDATVLCEPVLCILTSISFDHMAILGDTIEKIALEKAGIIKKNTPIITIDEKNGAFPVICREAKENNAPVFSLNYEDLSILKKSENYIDFSINSRYYKVSGLRIKSRADYQVENAALAVLAAKILLPHISDGILKKGLLGMIWEGRMEAIAKGVYVDGAHNTGAVRQIVKTLSGREEEWTLLFAVCEDKDYSGMIDLLAQVPWKRIYITRIEETRGASVEEVRQCFAGRTDSPLFEYNIVDAAFQAALHDRKEENLLCLGSLYLVGEIKRCVKKYL